MTKFNQMPAGLIHRRSALLQAGMGCGLLGLSTVLAQDQSPLGQPSVAPLQARPPHHTPAAKSVIWLFMNGGPSQVDTWDYKPELIRRDGQELEGFDPNTGFFTGAVGPLMKSPFSFRQYGESGTWVSELFPQTSQHVDKLAFIHSCWTDSNNHAPALFKMNTGSTRQGFPCMGSWLTYGLGSESRDLPAFLVMYDTLGRGVPKGHAQNWGAGFLPSVYQGTALKPQGQPIDNLQRPGDVSASLQRGQLDLLRELYQSHPAPEAVSTAWAAQLESFELAYRMQMTAPEIFDLSSESESIQRLYGLDNPKCGHFARQCLLARRCVEHGVRCVQIYSGGMENERSWDGHKDIAENHRGFALETDQPVAALLTDLMQRGLLEETLVIWGGEFGRLPIVQKGGTGRDHNPHAFTVWMAGGGIRGGTHYGETDDVGFRSIVDRVSIPDLHATILHQLGLDHERLTYRFNGRDFRLTDVSGRVVQEILA